MNVCGHCGSPNITLVTGTGGAEYYCPDCRRFLPYATTPAHVGRGTIKPPPRRR